ncbi:hypothetical protein CAP35_06595 [Chitinophagaceae bacterium IBVUCB1]|nr:hypothetical protein CAP35_06595 [Chitinophagaceae bacterium IBVUCB1]
MKMKIETLPLYDRLIEKILSFYATIWKDKLPDGIHNEWLGNFKNVDDDIQQKERLNALFLLSKFMYFGNVELRELLKCVFRDLYKYRVVKKIREDNNDTIDSVVIEQKYKEELLKTRFLGVGNPSESGVHILYYFRQENKLKKTFFINPLDVFQNQLIKEVSNCGKERSYYELSLADENITRYVFIDDFCGSGTQAKDYSKKIVELIKTINPNAEVSYLMLFGTDTGIDTIKKETQFDFVEAVFTLDESFKCFSENSRYYSSNQYTEIDKDFTKQFSQKYGQVLWPAHPLGYKDCQLLLSLFHNTPDNSLPTFWCDNNWNPIFKRYHKY